MQNYHYFLFLMVFVFCASIAAVPEKFPQYIPGLENECVSIDNIYKKLDTLTRDGQVVVYINREGVFEHPAHQLNIYKFCYDVNVELTAEQKALLAHYNAQKGHDAVGRVMREVPDKSPLYDQCARQTGMVVETIACALAPYPECGNVFTGIAEYYARLEEAEKRKKAMGLQKSKND